MKTTIWTLVAGFLTGLAIPGCCSNLGSKYIGGHSGTLLFNQDKHFFLSPK